MNEDLTYDELVAQSGISDEQQDDADEVDTDSETSIEEVTDEDSESDSEDTEDTSNSEDEEEEKKETATEQKPQKKHKNRYAQLLAERNAYKRQLDEKLSKEYSSDSIQDLEALATQRAEQIVEEKLFFRDNPVAREMSEEIKSVAREHNMDIETAYKFHLAMTNPKALLDPQELAKKESKKYSVSGTAKKVASKGLTDDEGYAQVDAYYKSRD